MVTRRVSTVGVLGLVLLLAGLSAANGAEYGTISAMLISVNPGQGVTYNVAAGDSPGIWRVADTTAGVFNLRRTDCTQTTNPPSGYVPKIMIPYDFETHCIDLSQYVYYSSQTWTVKDIADAPDPTLYTGGMTIGASGKVDLLQKVFRTQWSNDENLAPAVWAAARQIAVWEVVFEHWTNVNTPSGDRAYDVTDGSFFENKVGQTYADARAEANKMLDEALAYTWQDWELADGGAKKPQLYALVSGTYQDQLFAIVGGTTPPPVPEPLTVLGMVLGLGGVGAYIRRRRMA